MTATDRSLELVNTAAQAAADKLAHDIIAYDVSDVLSITDAFLLASAPNDRQVKSIVDEIEERLQKELGAKPVRREGDREARWVLLDYVDIVVHVQHSEERVFYALERLWKDCPELDLPEDAKATRGKAAEHAKHQAAEEAAGRTLGDELQEADLAIVDHGTLQARVRHCGDHAVGVTLASLLLGEPDAGVVRVGEPSGRKQVVRCATIRAQHRVLRCGLALELRGLHQHVPAVRVTHGEDVRHDGAEVAVGRDRRALDRDAGVLEVEVLDVGRPSGRHDHRIEDR